MDVSLRRLDVAERLFDGSNRLTAVVPVADNARNYYVQAALDDNGLTVEAVSDVHLEPEDRLSPSQLEALARLGWEGPGRLENYSRLLPRPVSLREAADPMVATLRDLCGLADVPALQITEVD